MGIYMRIADKRR